MSKIGKITKISALLVLFFILMSSIAFAALTVFKAEPIPESVFLFLFGLSLIGLGAVGRKKMVKEKGGSK